MKKDTIFVLRLLTMLFVALMPSLSSMARDYAPDEIVNPNVADRRVYVADPGNLVSDGVKQQVNSILYNLRRTTSAEVVVAVVPSIGDIPIEDFSEKLFTAWGIGKSDKDNGLLVLIAPEQRVARITTGYGLEGVLPDISAKKIVDRSIVANMKNGDLDAAVAAVAQDVATVISDPAAAEELRSSQKDKWELMPESPISQEDFFAIIGWFAIFIFLIACGLLVYDSRRLSKMDRYRRSLGWHERQRSYVLLAIFSLGLGIIPWLIARHKSKTSRNKPMQCPTCKAMMHKLSEEEDNAYLDPAQDLEERLNTVDYDVWVCPECNTIEKYPFRQQQSTYTECPYCHTVARYLVRDHTVVPSTYDRPGVGERIYECKYCHNRDNHRYNIPKKERTDKNALAAGALIGGMMGRGGGGGFGGGFGGGRTGGGGASGRW